MRSVKITERMKIFYCYAAGLIGLIPELDVSCGAGVTGAVSAGGAVGVVVSTGAADSVGSEDAMVSPGFSGAGMSVSSGASGTIVPTRSIRFATT